jgi:hypothetical protein
VHQGLTESPFIARSGIENQGEAGFRAQIEILREESKENPDRPLFFYNPGDPIGGFMSPDWRSPFDDEDGWTYVSTTMYVQARQIMAVEGAGRLWRKILQTPTEADRAKLMLHGLDRSDPSFRELQDIGILILSNLKNSQLTITPF